MVRQRHRHLAVADIAEAASVPRRTLERLFRLEIGRSPAAELLNMRLEKAAEMLLATPLSVADVAAQCGFSSAKYFATAFGRRYRTTPNAYRLKHLALHRSATPRL